MKINSLCEFAIPPDESFNLPPKKKKIYPPKKYLCLFHSSWNLRHDKLVSSTILIIYLEICLQVQRQNHISKIRYEYLKTKKKEEDTIWKEKISTFLNNFKMGYITKIVMVYKQAPKHWNFCFTRMFVWMENKENENEQVEEW